MSSDEFSSILDVLRYHADLAALAWTQPAHGAATDANALIVEDTIERSGIRDDTESVSLSTTRRRSKRLEERPSISYTPYFMESAPTSPILAIDEATFEEEVSLSIAVSLAVANTTVPDQLIRGLSERPDSIEPVLGSTSSSAVSCSSPCATVLDGWSSPQLIAAASLVAEGID